MCLGGWWGMGGRAICIAGWNCVRWWVWVWQWLAALLYNEGVSLLKIEGGWEVRWVVWGFHNGPLAAVLSVKLSKCHHLRFQHTPNRWLPVSAFISPTQNHIFTQPHFFLFTFHVVDNSSLWKCLSGENYQNAWHDAPPTIVRGQLLVCICVSLNLYRVCYKMSMLHIFADKLVTIYRKNFHVFKDKFVCHVCVFLVQSVETIKMPDAMQKKR